jgi:hypothetical protein
VAEVTRFILSARCRACVATQHRWPRVNVGSLCVLRDDIIDNGNAGLKACSTLNPTLAESAVERC